MNVLPSSCVLTHAYTLVRRFSLLVAIAGVALAASVQSAAAQVTYHYVGHPFTLFSCGPATASATSTCATPAPANTQTSYIATDHVEVTLVLNDPLPTNLTYQSISGLAGFSLSMNDGRHTVATPLTSGQGGFAEVSTDNDGNILDWRFVINTGGINNGGVATYTAPFGFVQDSGVLMCCGTTPGGDLALIQNNRGTWTFGTATPTPQEAVTDLINVVAGAGLGLTNGQMSSLTDKLNNALASIEAGQDKQAINQLKSFINSVQSSVKTGKISASAGTTLIDAANAIIALLT